MRIYGVMVVRNEADILRVNVLHHLAQGIDFLLVADNDSSDGTAEVLSDLVAGGRVSWTRIPGRFLQAGITTALAREAFLMGADWVVPIDADELWWTAGGDLRSVIAEHDAVADAIEVEVVNFVQRRDQERRTPDALLHMTCRAPRPLGEVSEVRELVERNEIAFVEAMYAPKWISRAAYGLEIHQGNHKVTGIDPDRRAHSERIVCLHGPLRARDILEAQVDHGRRIEELGQYLTQAWHVRRWRRLHQQGELDLEWRANSYATDGDDEVLDLYGVRRPLVADTRWRDAVAPWLADATLPPKPSETVPALPERLELDAEGQGRWPTGLVLSLAILARMREVDGWLRDDEADLLLASATQAVALPGEVVEIGSYLGRSTVGLASIVRALAPERKVMAIDPHEGEVGTADTPERREPTWDAFLANLEAHGVMGHVEPVRRRSHEVEWDRPVAFLFIDGLHDEASVRRDFEHFEPHVVPGGFVAFHDHDDLHLGVVAVVDEVLAGGRYHQVHKVGALIVVRKVPDGEEQAADDGLARELRVRIGRQKEALTYLRSEIARRDGIVGEREDAIEWLRRRLERQRIRTAALRDELDQQLRAWEDLRDLHEREVAALRGSLSWKVTRPLRWLAGLLRRGA